MLAPQHKYLLRRTSPRPGPPMKGATRGPPQRSIGSGLLRFQFPAASVVAGLLSTQALPALAVQVCPPGVDAPVPRKADAAADERHDTADLDGEGRMLLLQSCKVRGILLADTRQEDGALGDRHLEAGVGFRVLDDELERQGL